MKFVIAGLAFLITWAIAWAGHLIARIYAVVHDLKWSPASAKTDARLILYLFIIAHVLILTGLIYAT